ncbi:wax ester/triacylglycerol synthase family O-acyltransferase [soil metagenome]
MGAMLPNDFMFLDAEGREKPMHVGGLQLFQPPPDAGPDFAGRILRAMVAHDDIDPRLRHRPVRMAGGIGPWSWEEDPDLDVEYHVRHSALPHPGRIRELLALTSRLHGTMLHRSRPLWEAHLIEGLEDGRFALYTKIHHALVDGMTAMRMLQESLTTDPDLRDMLPPLSRHPRPARDPGQPKAAQNPISRAAELLGGTVTGALDTGRAVIGSTESAAKAFWRSFGDEAVAFPYRAPRSILNVPISGARRFAADSYDLQRVDAVRSATGATLNDVLMGMCGGALRAYLTDIGELPDDPLIACVPVALKKEEGGSGGNAVGVVLCNLGTHLDDPADRFELIRESMRQGKLRFEGLNPIGQLLLSGLAFAPLALGPLFRFEQLRRPPFNLVISNVPGPRQAMYYDGAKLDGLYPLSIPTDGQAMNITANTYDGKLNIGLTGCRRSVPSLQRLLEHLDTALTELEAL